MRGRLLSAAGLILLCAAASPCALAQGATHVVGMVQGRVEVKRAGWTKFVLAGRGTQLQDGDMVRLASPDARATIFCANASVQKVPTSPYTLQCPSGQPVIKTYKGGRVTKARGDTSSNKFPVVLAPRMSKILTARPVLRWLPLNGVEGYKVSIMRGPEVVWSEEVGNVTELVYPAAAPALNVGVTYRLIVAAGQRSSENDRTPNLGFTLVTEAEAKPLNAAAAKIRAPGLPDATTRFLLANLYATWGVDPNNPDSDVKAFNYEAIEQLRGTAGETEPAATRLLGELYLTIALPGLAEEQYKKAISQSEALGDVQGQALAEYALGTLYKSRNLDGASQRLLNAKALFLSFGDAASAAKVDGELSELQRR